jgi:hypothetical protein
MAKLSLIVACAGLLIAASLPAMAQDNPAITLDLNNAVIRAVKICVDKVHSSPPRDAIQAQFLREFDAYYNPGTKRVMNNGYRNGDIPAQYEFNKCMAAQGFPQTE